MEEAQYAETTWLEGISQIQNMDTPQGAVLLILLTNGHRYALPMFNPQVRQAIYRIASPIAIADKLPVNGPGTRKS